MGDARASLRHNQQALGSHTFSKLWSNCCRLELVKKRIKEKLWSGGWGEFWWHLVAAGPRGDRFASHRADTIRWKGFYKRTSAVDCSFLLIQEIPHWTLFGIGSKYIKTAKNAWYSTSPIWQLLLRNWKQQKREAPRVEEVGRILFLLRRRRNSLPTHTSTFLLGSRQIAINHMLSALANIICYALIWAAICFVLGFLFSKKT